GGFLLNHASAGFDIAAVEEAAQEGLEMRRFESLDQVAVAIHDRGDVGKPLEGCQKVVDGLIEARRDDRPSLPQHCLGMLIQSKMPEPSLQPVNEEVRLLLHGGVPPAVAHADGEWFVYP